MRQFGQLDNSQVIHLATVYVNENNVTLKYASCGAGENHRGQTWRSYYTEFYLVEADAPTCKRCVKKLEKLERGNK